jgi:hypothetical protein
MGGENEPTSEPEPSVVKPATPAIPPPPPQLSSSLQSQLEGLCSSLIGLLLHPLFCDRDGIKNSSQQRVWSSAAFYKFFGAQRHGTTLGLHS